MTSQIIKNIPHRKIIEALEQTIRNCEICSKNSAVKIDQNLCKECHIKNIAVKRYAESNIPVRYWNLELERDFKGDQTVLDTYKELTRDLKKTYSEGTAICLAGSHGIGKTYLLTNILKRCVEKSYSALYSNLTDIINMLIYDEHKLEIRKELLLVDFLAIDEFDPRFFPTDKSSDLFGRVLEEIFRNRSQNALPTFMSTNSPNVIEGFNGGIKDSITSLMGLVKTIPIFGKDFRHQK